ncbi:MAG: hypothetical protein FWC71_03945 [Defluviitaleaceae bacterium]|nr:hypothetical protein [Defluviitaleaceae bacterium]
MTFRDSHYVGIFVICNVLVVLLVYAVVMRPVRTSAEQMRVVVEMQERRLEIYTQQLSDISGIVTGDAEADGFDGMVIGQIVADEAITNREEDVAGSNATSTQLIRHDRITEALGEFERAADRLGLHTVSFSSQAPILSIAGQSGAGVWEDARIYDVRVMALYRGQVDALVDFVQILDADAARVRGLHIDFLSDGEAALRLDFSLLAFFTDGGIE